MRIFILIFLLILFNKNVYSNNIFDTLFYNIEFTSENRDKLDLAYAITIHKSQGSEYRAVVIPVSSNHIHMLTRKLLYTGITRGKEMVCLVGEKQAFKTALQIYRQDFRYTNLSYEL